jgi:flavin reductase
MTSGPVDGYAFRALMRNIVGHVSIIASGEPGQRFGLTATAVCSVSDDPPTVLVCVNRLSGTHDVIIKNGHFSINVLAKAQEDIARVFSGGAGIRGEARFGTGTWSEGVTGSPLLTGAACRIECKLFDCWPSHTHTVFFGRVAAGDSVTDAEPLLYHQGAYTTFGTPSQDFLLGQPSAAGSRRGIRG